MYLFTRVRMNGIGYYYTGVGVDCCQLNASLDRKRFGEPIQQVFAT